MLLNMVSRKRYNLFKTLIIQMHGTDSKTTSFQGGKGITIMKISTLDSSNFRLYNSSNSIDGRNLSAQDIKKKLGLEDIKYSIAKIGESHTFEEDTRDVVQFSARAKSSAYSTGENIPVKTESSGTSSLMAAVDNDLKAKGWTLDHYYSLLFKLDVPEANKAFGTRFSISSSGLPDTTEQTML